MALPDDVRADMLDPEVRADLSSLARETADVVARHLVVAGRLIDDDPEQALTHARAAGALAGRVGAVREAAGLTAYAAGEWAEALSELRAARRITGRADHLAVMADCERALGRPERALAYADDPEARGLDQALRVELVLVLAGARRDLGQKDAAVLLLQGPAGATTARRPWAARLWYGYADALLDAGREAEARDWFARAAEVDTDGATDADERLLELEGVVFDDAAGPSEPDTDEEQGPVDDQEAPAAHDAASLAALVADMVPFRAAEPVVGEPVQDDGTKESQAEQDAAPAAAPAVQPAFRAPDLTSPFSGVVEEPVVPVAAPVVPGVAFVAADLPDDEPDHTHDDGSR